MKSMRSERDRLEEQLRLVFDGEAWHGPSVMEALKDVNAELAAQHPIDGAHSIWELVLHLAWTYGLVLRKLTAGTQPGLGRPTIGHTCRCHPLRRTGSRRSIPFGSSTRRFAARLPAFRTIDWTTRRPKTRAIRAYTQFIGLTQHDAYHAGQIVLLKRAVQAERGPAAHDA
jgi:uncharacterized damage-inducible protein DinB